MACDGIYIENDRQEERLTDRLMDRWTDRRKITWIVVQIQRVKQTNRSANGHVRR